jgi:predicted RND superfamily exporter protein
VNPLSRTVLRRPGWTLAAVALLTVAALPGLARLKLRTDGQALIPPQAPEAVYDREIRREFGVRDPLVAVIRTDRPEGIFQTSTLRRVRELTAALARLDGIGGISGIGGIGEQGVTSLATERGFHFRAGTLQRRTLLDPLPATPAAIAELRADLARIGVWDGLLIGRGGQSAAVVVGVPPGVDRIGFYRQARAVASAHEGGGDRIEVVGAPAAETLLGSHILADLGIPAVWLGVEPEGERIGLLPLAIVLMALVFRIAFGRFAAAALPLLKVGTCLLLLFGLMGWLGLPVYLTTAVLPVLLIAVGTASEVHLFRRFAAMRAERPDAASAELTALAVAEVERPVLQAAATTAVGFLSFSLSPVGPVRAFGLFAAAGVLLCLLGSLTAIPAALSLLPRGWIAGHRTGGATPPARFFSWLGSFAVRRRRSVLIVTAAVTLLAADGARRLMVQDSWVDGFAPRSGFARAMRRFDRDFAGSYVLRVVVEAPGLRAAGTVNGAEVGDRSLTLPAFAEAPPRLLGSFLALRGGDPPLRWSSWVADAQPRGDRIALGWPVTGGSPRFELAPRPEEPVSWELRLEPLAVPATLERVRELERFLAGWPGVGRAQGPAEFLETTAFLTRPDTPGSRRLPDSPRAAAILWNNAERVLGPERLRGIVNAGRTRGLVSVFLRGSNYAETARLMAALRAWERERLLPHGIRLGFAGDVAVSQALIGGVVTTQVESLALSLMGIFAITAGLSRSLRHGLLCTVPAAFAVLLNFAVMGWLGIPLGVATSMFAGMTLGVGVDYAIHLLDRRERLRRRGLDGEAAAMALAATGPAILTDVASTVLGFSVLLFSQVPANHRLGGLLALSLLSCVAVTLLVVPALAERRGPALPSGPLVLDQPSSAPFFRTGSSRARR